MKLYFYEYLSQSDSGMSTRRISAFLVFLLLVTLMEEAKPVLGGKGGGKFSKLSNRVKELEESMEELGECKEGKI